MSGADEAAPDTTESSDEELCWAWRHSFVRLLYATEAEAVARLAQRRGEYLDELERRHPARFAAWISSGPRSAGDPTPFFRSHRTLSGKALGPSATQAQLATLGPRKQRAPHPTHTADYGTNHGTEQGTTLSSSHPW